MHTQTRPARRLRALSATVAAIIGLTAAVAGTVPTAATAASGPSTSVTGGTLDWGFKQSFRNYVPAAGQSVSGGASKNADGTFRFAASGGSYDPATRKLTVTGSGAAVFDYRAHTFVISLRDPAIELTPTTGTLTAGVDVRLVDPTTGATTSDPGTKRIAFATIDVTKGTRSVTDGAYSWTGLPTTITAAGAAAFAADVTGGGNPTQFYAAGTALDPLSVAVTGDWAAEGTDGDGGADGDQGFSDPGVQGLVSTGVQTTVGDSTIGRVTTVVRDAARALTVVQVPAAGTAKASYFIVDDDGKRVAGPIDPGVATSKPSVDPSTGNIVATASLPAAEFGGTGSNVQGYVVVVRGTDAAYRDVVHVKPSVAVPAAKAFAIDPADGSIVAQVAPAANGGSAGLLRVAAVGAGAGSGSGSGADSGAGSGSDAVSEVGTSPAGGTVRAVTRTATLIDSVTGTISSVGVDWTGKRAVVFDQAAALARVVALDTGASVADVSIGATATSGAAGGTVVDSRGRAWWSNDGDATLRAVSLRGTPAVTTSIDRVGGAAYLAVDESAKRLWVSAAGSTDTGNVVRAYAIDGSTAPTLGAEYTPGTSYTGDPIVVAADGRAVVGVVNAATDAADQGLRTFTVVTTPTVTAQPADVAVTLTGATTGTDGSTTPATPQQVSFAVTTTGTPTPTVQWQQHTPSGWADLQDGPSVAGATTSTLRITATEGLNGDRYRAVATNVLGATVVGRVASDTATLRVTVQAPTNPGGGNGGGGSTVVGADGSITGAENARGASTNVRPATGLSTAAAGSKLTVTGSGFTKNTNGSGLYVLFGYVTKHPSAGGAAGAGYDYVPGSGGTGQDGQGFVAWPDNTGTGAAATAKLSGTKNAGFTQGGVIARSTFTGQSTKRVDCLSGAVQCGVLTIGAHGAADAALETFTPVYFAGQTVPGTLPTGPSTGGGNGGTVIQPPVVQLPPAATAPTITNASDTAPTAAPIAEPTAVPRNTAAQPRNSAKAPSAAEPPTAPAADSDELARKIDVGDIPTVAAADAGIPDEVTAGDQLELRLPWTGDDEGGSVWTYSEPVQGDDFTVEDRTATASVDTTGLEVGDHHVVLVGDQGTVVAVPFTVVDGVGAVAQSADSGAGTVTAAADGGAGGGMTTETLLLVVIGFLGGLVVLAIGLVVLLLTGVLQVRTRPKPVVAPAAAGV